MSQNEASPERVPTDPQPRHRAIQRRDYRAPAYRAETIDLTLNLDEAATRVTARTLFCRTGLPPKTDASADNTSGEAPLELLGQDMDLVSLSLDGKSLDRSRYTIDSERLVISGLPERFTLTTVGILRPSLNKSLEGLYLSNGTFCTQCEAQGFRKITWSLDRPDVMARYSTRIEADAERYPVLLSNGNLVEQGALPEGRHFALWEDPFPKPSYLFAMVAGQLVHREDRFRTASGRDVTLRVYVRSGDLDQTEHCMESLKKAMRWDEESFGREYDLDVYMIVAVSDFNMGAMENKGLNIFNTKYVLARHDTATDRNFLDIEAVVAHEYFHNWSGNRITCRDWFQLSLKEGFTVFRDQEFSADVGSRALKRIQDVQRLQATQFPEDSSPTAHPVRPDSYVEINNFYTATVYEKGAEVVRMMQTLLGAEKFRAGCDLYFSRHDGQAVTCDDFVRAMEDASGANLVQFRTWYAQAGTPWLEAEGQHDPDTARYSLTLRQRTDPTPGQREKKPLHIPVVVGLLDQQGQDLGVAPPEGCQAIETDGNQHSTLVELRTEATTVVFEGVAEPPVPSVLRGFSAPVRLETHCEDSHLLLRMGHDSDPFNRWQASQTLTQRRLLAAIAEAPTGGISALQFDTPYVEAFRQVLLTEGDEALRAESLALPDEQVLSDRLQQVDPEQVHMARQRARHGLALRLSEDLRSMYDALTSRDRYEIEPRSVGRRSLRNLCLDYLMALEPPGSGGLAVRQLEQSTNMTDTLAALSCLTHVEGPVRSEALTVFYERHADEPLVVDMWFAIQAASSRRSALAEVESLLSHPAFDLHNPNKVRALVDGFARTNPVNFHTRNGAGHRFLADRIMDVDDFNPQVAARLVSRLSRFGRYVPAIRDSMVKQLQRIAACSGLSRDVGEQVERSLEVARTHHD